jgi:hypothetical protein
MSGDDSTDRTDEELSPMSDRASDPIAQMLRGALKESPSPKRSLLPQIQQRIRITTRGRYFRDRWSTARDPVPLLLMAALLILILCAAVFLVMQPLVEAPQKTKLPSPATDLLAPTSQPDLPDEPQQAPAEPQPDKPAVPTAP